MKRKWFNKIPLPIFWKISPNVKSQVSLAKLGSCFLLHKYNRYYYNKVLSNFHSFSNMYTVLLCGKKRKFTDQNVTRPVP